MHSELGQSICGGKVGSKGEKMCVLPMTSCTHKSHRKTSADFIPRNISQSGTYLMISVSKTGQEVWLSQSATFEMGGKKWNTDWQNDVRPKQVWAEILRSVSSARDEETIEFYEELAAKNHLEVLDTGGVSPRKRSVPDLMDRESTIEENREDWSDFDMQAANRDPDDYETAIHRLESKVEFISKKMRATPFDDMFSDTKRLDHQVAALSNKVGYDQAETEPMSVMEHVNHMGLKIEEVKTVLKTDEVQKKHVQTLFSLYEPTLSGLINGCMESCMNAVTKRIMPIEAFFSDTRISESSAIHANPPILGVHLMDRLACMEKKPNQHQTVHGSVGSGVHFGQSAFGVQPASAFGGNPSVVPSTTQVEVGKLVSMVNNLESELRVVKADFLRFKRETDSTQVKISVEVWDSRDEFKAWWLANMPQDVKDAHTCFPDAMGLLSLATGSAAGVNSDYEQMSFASKSTNAGYANQQAAVLHLSCDKPLPLMFGTKSDDNDIRTLPLCKSFEEWDKQDGYSLFKDKRWYEIESQMTQLNHKSRACLNSYATLVAATCIADAGKFVLFLFEWMSRTMNILNGANGGIGRKSAKENWSYVSHSVRAVFDHLHSIRRKGSLHRDDPASMIWEFLKMREEQERIMSMGLNQFPAVANVLQLHMKKNAVMRTEFSVALSRMEELCTKSMQLAEKAKKVADAAGSKKAGKKD